MAAERLADGRHVVEVEEALRLGLFDAQHASLADLAAAESAGPESVADLAAGSAASLTARSAGTRAPSKRIVAVAEPVRPIFRSGGSASRPAVSAGTRKHEMPPFACPEPVEGSEVRAISL